MRPSAHPGHIETDEEEFYDEETDDEESNEEETNDEETDEEEDTELIESQEEDSEEDGQEKVEVDEGNDENDVSKETKSKYFKNSPKNQSKRLASSRSDYHLRERQLKK